MKMPDAETATMDVRKITRYLLVPEHQDNGGKAKFFASCGFNLDNVDVFQSALLEHPVINSVQKTTTSDAGVKYVVECRLTTPNGLKPCIRTVWIDDGESPPRLVTAYPFQ